MLIICFSFIFLFFSLALVNWLFCCKILWIKNLSTKSFSFSKKVPKKYHSKKFKLFLEKKNNEKAIHLFADITTLPRALSFSLSFSFSSYATLTKCAKFLKVRERKVKMILKKSAYKTHLCSLIVIFCQKT